MYKIIGADQKEYGPVEADQIRKWITERRANSKSLVKPDGGPWTPLGALPEFKKDLGPETPPPPPKPISPAKPPLTLSPGNTDVDRLANEVLVRGYDVDIADCFSRAWALLQQNFWLSVGASAITLLILLGLASIPAIGYAAELVLIGPLFGGLYWFFLRLARGERAELGDVFIGFGSLFVPLLLAGIVQSVLISLGLALCIVPGIYLMTIWLFSLFLILDRKMDFWPAMELSRKVVSEQWWPVFGLMLLTCLVFWAGSLLLCVGIFVTAPLATAALAYAYLDVFESPRGVERGPTAPRPGSASRQPAKSEGKAKVSLKTSSTKAAAKAAVDSTSSTPKPATAEAPATSAKSTSEPSGGKAPTATAKVESPKAKVAKAKTAKKAAVRKSTKTATRAVEPKTKRTSTTARPKSTNKGKAPASPKKAKRSTRKPDSP